MSHRSEQVGGATLGETLSLKDLTLPVCAIACETDHIAAWKDCYRGVQQMGGRSRTFIVSESGHIAGIVNPPAAKKYGYWTSDADYPADPDAWFEGATAHEGSWWPHWYAWVAKQSGRKTSAARTPGSEAAPALEDAPGSYVKVRSDEA